MIEIRKNVPMPRHGKTKYPWHAMEVGDSFAFPAGTESKAAYAAAYSASRDGKKFITRKQNDGTYACWRDK